MSCCAPDTRTEVASDASVTQDAAHQEHGCIRAGHPSRSVSRRTLLLMLKPESFGRVGTGEYRFCAEPLCRVVYFTDGDAAEFTTDDVRVRVGIKERADPIPLCYCFGFDEAGAREEIAAAGRSTLPTRITSLVKQSMCACETRNPSGACCLGEINKIVKRLMEEESEK